MIHSNQYFFPQQGLENSVSITLKEDIESLRSLVITMGADNDDDPDNTLRLDLTTSPDFRQELYDYSNRFIPGANLPLVELQILINDVDHSDYLINQLNVVWGEDSNGTCSFNLKKIRPFSSFPVKYADSEIKVGAPIIIKTLTRIKEFTHTHTVFTGKIVSFNYDMWTDITSVECLDNSFDVSRLGDKLSQEFVTADAYYTSISSPVPGAPSYNNDQAIYVLGKVASLTKNNLIGVFQASDTRFKTNLLIDEREDVFTIYNLPQNTLSLVHVDLTKATQTLRDIILTASTKTLAFKFLLDPKEVIAIQGTPIKKSALIRQIALISGIEDMKIMRENMPEDEFISGSVTANNEFPLDFIRKIIVPQAWRAYYNERGTLIIDRERLTTTPVATFTDVNIISNTLKITQDLDQVINVQEVAGVTVVQPTNSGGVPRSPSNPNPEPPNKSGVTCKDIVLKTYPITGGGFTISKNATQAELDSLLNYVHDEIILSEYDLQGGYSYLEGIHFFISPSTGSSRNFTVFYDRNIYTLQYLTRGPVDKPALVTMPIALRLANMNNKNVTSKGAVVETLVGSLKSERNALGLTFTGLPTDVNITQGLPFGYGSPCTFSGAGTYRIPGYENYERFGFYLTAVAQGTFNETTGDIVFPAYSAIVELVARVTIE